MTGVRENCDGLTKAVPEMGREMIVGGGEVEVRGAQAFDNREGCGSLGINVFPNG